MLWAIKVILVPVPELRVWTVMLDWKITPVLILALWILAVMVGRKVISEPISVWRVLAAMVGCRVIQDIRRVSNLVAVDLPVLTVADRQPARAVLLLAAYRSS